MDKKIYELTDLIDNDIAESIYTAEEKKKIANELKPLLSDNSVVLAQTNPVCGNIKHNALKAKKYIDWAELLGIKTLIFPEAYLIGLPLGDYIQKFPIVTEECREWLEALAKNVRNTKVLIGFVEYDYSASAKKYYNSIAVLANGKIEQIIKKDIISKDLNNKKVTDVNGKKAGILIGAEERDNPDLIKNLTEKEHTDLIISCSSDISRTGKEYHIYKTFQTASKEYNTAFMYINQTGSADCVSFNGASSVYNNKGDLIYRAKSFQEQFFIVDIDDNNGQIYPTPLGTDSLADYEKEFSFDYEADLDRIYKTIIQSIKDYFKKTGFKHACLGLSGGLDSTVCAVLLADALGKENVFGISMPSKITSNTSKNDAKELAQNLGINFLEIPIKNIFDTTRDTFNELFSKMEEKWDFRYKQSYTNDNIQARARATILWGIANEFESCLTIATSDKSEAYMGYATINGDMSGSFAPIADVTKTKLFALAKWLNKNRLEKNAIPQSIIDKRPGAELAINPETGKPLLAEEALMPYEFLDEVIWRVENLNQSINDMIDEEFLYEKTEKISREQKLEWLEKFFRRMSTALYKWSIMVPGPIIDTHSINKAEYQQPIISSGINYKKTSFEEKLSMLKTD